MTAKANCWEFMSCGREPGGSAANELGACPAATDESADGINGGHNGGRLCWAIAGTFCGGKVQGSQAAKRQSCLTCEFFERVTREEERSTAAPTEISGSQSRRLMIFALVCAAVFALYLALYRLLWPGAVNSGDEAISVATLIGSLAVAFYARAERGPGASSVVGFGYEALLALALSAMELRNIDPELISNQVSWTCVLIVFFPLIVPSSPRATVFASLLTASMSPLAYGLCVALGAPTASSTAVLLSRLIPQYICALCAFVPAMLLHRLFGQMKRARKLGSYELVAPLGQGGMGEVWRARHRMLVRPAAIKLIRPDGDRPEKMQVRFEREAQATATLQSPHTVQLYDFGIADDGAFYYVMELLRGIDLAQLVERFGPLPPERVIHLLIQACDSLDDAHRIGLVHRDIKPANIFVTKVGRSCDFVKVLDFGLVKLGKPADTTTTGQNTILGTPAYLAPEIATGEEDVDGRADVYALGCVAYCLLTGQPVFEANTPMEMAVAHVSSRPPPLSSRTDRPMPESLDQIVMNCLAKKPQDRPTAFQLAQKLKQAAVERAWTDERAQQWWTAHLPDMISGDRDVQQTHPIQRLVDPEQD